MLIHSIPLTLHGTENSKKVNSYLRSVLMTLDEHSQYSLSVMDLEQRQQSSFNINTEI